MPGAKRFNMWLAHRLFPSVRRLRARLAAAEDPRPRFSPDWLASEFNRREPWYTQFCFDGRSYGGPRYFPPDFRLKLFYRHVAQRSRVLELGALEGGHSFEIARAPGVSSVVAIEGRPSNVEKARFVQGINGITNVTFVHGDLRTLDLWEFAHVDAIFCSGILYHLPEPWTLIQQCARLAPAIFIWTHYCLDELATETVNGYRVFRYDEGDVTSPLSGLQPQSLWLTLGGLVSLLAKSGYDEVRVLKLEQRAAGPAASLVALRA